MGKAQRVARAEPAVVSWQPAPLTAAVFAISTANIKQLLAKAA